MSEKKNSIGTIVFGWCCLIGFFFAGFWLGRQETDIDAEINRVRMRNELVKVYEDLYREELDSVYELLSAQAFSIRANMNLSLKTNHYLTHEFHEKLCPDCIEHYQYIVEKMPEMPERDQVWFEFFNKTLTEISEEIADE
jgi:hypothetical protein